MKKYIVLLWKKSNKISNLETAFMTAVEDLSMSSLTEKAVE
jgi:hypothetical protein